MIQRKEPPERDWPTARRGSSKDVVTVDDYGQFGGLIAMACPSDGSTGSLDTRAGGITRPETPDR